MASHHPRIVQQRNARNVAELSAIPHLNDPGLDNQLSAFEAR
jgi:hypothetical protein